jgi:hypothetical protein
MSLIIKIEMFFHFWLVSTAIATAKDTGIFGFIGIMAVMGWGIKARHLFPTASPKSHVVTFAGKSRSSRLPNIASTTAIIATAVCHHRVTGYDAQQDQHKGKTL